MKDLSKDDTSSFPPVMKKKWFWAQRGRHWSSSTKKKMLNGDYGRGPMGVVTEKDEQYCEISKDRGECLTSGDVRANCPKTCNVFIDDEIYKPGEEDRRAMFGF